MSTKADKQSWDTAQDGKPFPTEAYRLGSYKLVGLWREAGTDRYLITDDTKGLEGRNGPERIGPLQTYYVQDCVSPEAALLWFSQVCAHGLAPCPETGWRVGFIYSDKLPKEILSAASEVARTLTFLLREYDPEDEKKSLPSEHEDGMERLAHKLLAIRLGVGTLAEEALSVDFVLEAD